MAAGCRVVFPLVLGMPWQLGLRWAVEIHRFPVRKWSEAVLLCSHWWCDHCAVPFGSGELVRQLCLHSFKDRKTLKSPKEHSYSIYIYIELYIYIYCLISTGFQDECVHNTLPQISQLNIFFSVSKKAMRGYPTFWDKWLCLKVGLPYIHLFIIIFPSR